MKDLIVPAFIAAIVLSGASPFVALVVIGAAVLTWIARDR